MSNKIPCGGFYLDDTLGVDENGKLGINQFVVTFTMSEEGSIASDKTFDEIFDAYKAGKKVFGVLLNAPNDWTECYVSSVNEEIIDFFTMTSAIDDGTIGCQYVVLSVPRIGGASVIVGLLTQAK